MEEKLDRIIELLEKIISNQTLMNGGDVPSGCEHDWVYYNNTTAPHKKCTKCGEYRNVNWFDNLPTFTH